MPRSPERKSAPRASCAAIIRGVQVCRERINPRVYVQRVCTHTKLRVLVFSTTGTNFPFPRPVCRVYGRFVTLSCIMRTGHPRGILLFITLLDLSAYNYFSCKLTRSYNDVTDARIAYRLIFSPRLHCTLDIVFVWTRLILSRPHRFR